MAQLKNGMSKFLAIVLLGVFVLIILFLASRFTENASAFLPSFTLVKSLTSHRQAFKTSSGYYNSFYGGQQYNLSLVVPKEITKSSKADLQSRIDVAKNILQPFYGDTEFYGNTEGPVISPSAVKWPQLSNQNYNIADGYSHDFFDILQKHDSIQVLKLYSNMSLVKNALFSNFYDYSSNDCIRLQEKSIYGKDKGKVMYNARCHTLVKNTLSPHPLPISAFALGLPQSYHQNTNKPLLSFLMITQKAIISRHGDIYINGLKIAIQRCMQNLENKGPSLGLSQAPVYDKVITIAQFWGEGYFHSMVEQLTRLAIYIPFLQKHTDIKIHLSADASFLTGIFRHLGLSPRRLVFGNIRAKLLYAPAGSACARSAIFGTELMSLLYRVQLNTTDEYRNSIVLIRRSPGKRRWFDHHDEILEMVTASATQRRLRVEVFRDDPVPSFKETVAMFNRALLIIGPHGAGLSNMFFSKPGTAVIEGLCYDAGQANLCYSNAQKNSTRADGSDWKNYNRMCYS